MKADKIRQLDTAELTSQLRDMNEQIGRLGFQMTMGQMEGLKKYRALRKDRARIETILRERNVESRIPSKG